MVGVVSDRARVMHIKSFLIVKINKWPSSIFLVTILEQLFDNFQNYFYQSSILCFSNFYHFLH